MSEIPDLVLPMFSQCVGDTFRIHSDAEQRTVQLVEATGRASGSEGGEPPPDARDVSIVFHDAEGTKESHLPQAIYRQEHDNLGSLDLFVVPIGPDSVGKGIRHEAVFTSMDSP